MAILKSPCPLNSKHQLFLTSSTTITTPTPTPTLSSSRHHRSPHPLCLLVSISSQLYNHKQTPPPVTNESVPATSRARIDKSFLDVSEATLETELWAAAYLRIRTFYDFQDQSFGIQFYWDHKRYLTDREFEALKECIIGTMLGFKRVSCINATLPLSQVASISDDLCSSCKFTKGEEEWVVVGTLDLNQCIRLPDEITGMKPKVIIILVSCEGINKVS